MTDIRIPEPGGAAIPCAPTTIAGTKLCGERLGADSYVDYQLLLASGQTSNNVIIPEPFFGNTVCGKVICGVPPTLCGEGIKGDRYFDYPVELTGDPVTLYVEVILRIQVDDVIPLELDGVEGLRVNPVLMPSECEPLEPEPLVCLEA